MKKWSEIPKEQRERVLSTIDWYTRDATQYDAALADAYRAAAALLAEAQPYPDEALAFEITDVLMPGRWHVADFDGFTDHDDQTLCFRHTNGTFHGIHMSVLRGGYESSMPRPLTPAAADLLSALRGGE